MEMALAEAIGRRRSWGRAERIRWRGTRAQREPVTVRRPPRRPLRRGQDPELRRLACSPGRERKEREAPDASMDPVGEEEREGRLWIRPPGVAASKGVASSSTVGGSRPWSRAVARGRRPAGEGRWRGGGRRARGAGGLGDSRVATRV